MTSPRPPRAPLPDWSDGLREGTESLSIRPDEALSRPAISPYALEPLAMGTSEGDDTSSELAALGDPDELARALALDPVMDPAIEPPAARRLHRPLTDSPLAALAALAAAAPARARSPGAPPPRPAAPAGHLPSLAPAAPLDPSEDRTKVDVRVMRPRPAKPNEAHEAKEPADDGLELVGSSLGSYRLIARIGKGGMGHVYRAEHVRLGREVALKLLRQDYAKRKDAVARFFQEARTVNRVRHRNIVDVTDFVELDDGTTFIIMELLTGQSLSSWVRSGIEVPRALAILAQICEGLAAAHSVNVIHRDLKPDNVIIVREPEGGELVKLLDFGVAKLINQGDDENFGVETAAGSVVGTPAYMSPEQAGGLPIDGRSDIYSLGAIMYELFCGQTMFRGRSFGEYVRKHLTEHPVPPRATSRGARLDPRIEAIILRAIEKEPARRYQTVGELRDELMGLLSELGELGQSGQRTIAPLPGASGRLPVLSAPAQLGGGAMLPMGPGPSGLGGTGGLGGTAGPGSRSFAGEQAPLAELSMESEELSRSGARRSLAGPPSYVSARGDRGDHSDSGPAVHTHLVRPTPWFVWFVGGALAVGLGIGGATLYARSLEPEPVVTAAPALTELPEPIALRLVSVPPGASVVPRGSETELCRAPCTVDVAAADATREPVRVYAMRLEGYRELILTVDLADPRREYRFELAAAAPAAPIEPIAAPIEPSATEPATEDTDAKPAGKNKRPAKGKRSAKGGDDPGDDFELPATPPSTEPAPRPTADPIPTPIKPAKAGKIDSSETIDPFRTRP